MSAMPLKDDALSRRGFIGLVVKTCLAGSALMGLGVLLRYLGYQNEGSPPSEYDLGLALDYPLGSRITVQAAQAMVIHNSQGYTAISLVCPHLGCRVEVAGDGFACPCHGSRFMPDGSLLNGPASKSLTALQVETNAEGHLILYYS
jgi:cytochrome b6-f complex iron-sulfur subunit